VSACRRIGVRRNVGVKRRAGMKRVAIHETHSPWRLTSHRSAWSIILTIYRRAHLPGIFSSPKSLSAP
jgi:hypothetical protein